MGWVTAVEDAAYTVLRTPIGNQEALAALVCTEGDMVRLAVPEAAENELDASIVLGFADVRLATLRDRGRATSLNKRVLFLDVDVGEVTPSTVATLEKAMVGCMVFSARDGRNLPMAEDLVQFGWDLVASGATGGASPGGAAGSGGGAAADAAVAPAMLGGAAGSPGPPGSTSAPDLSVIMDALITLSDRMHALETRPPAPPAGQAAGVPGGAAQFTPFLGGGPKQTWKPLLQGGAPLPAPKSDGNLTPTGMLEPPEPQEPQLAGMLALMAQMCKQQTGYEPPLGAAVTDQDLLADSSKLGAAQIERLKLTRAHRPQLVIQAHEREVVKDLGALPGESWSYMRHAKEKVLPSAAGHAGLKKTVVLLAHALDLHRTTSADQAYAFLSQAYKAAQAASYHPNKQWTYAWPLLGVDDPDGQMRPGLTAAEHAALAAYHRDQEVIARQIGGGSGTAQRGGGAAAATGGGGYSQDDGANLRGQVEKLKRELMEERKKKAGKGNGKGGAGSKGSEE